MSHTATTQLQPPPLALYIHIPWCVQKCPYCDFNSHEKNSWKESAYITALKKDLDNEKHWQQGRKISSIFLGGGTPSLFSAVAIADILNYAEQHIGFSHGIEITLEANPGTAEQQKFRDFFLAGINRLSLGIQSFNENHLKTLGRIHGSDEAKRAVTMAKQAGFTQINLDLMHGLPHQTLEEALQDIETAIQFSPQHISWYQLTIEPNTHFYRQPPPLPADDTLADIQHHGSQRLAQHGFVQYEVSAFAKEHCRSKHNINYWQFGDYIGIGAGAHGKNTDITNGQVIRRQKTRLPGHYLDYQEHPKYKEHIIDNSELTLEFMMNALRLNQGVPSHYFTKRTGLALSTIEKPLSELQRQGLLKDSNENIVTTELGQRFLNSVLERFDTTI